MADWPRVAGIAEHDQNIPAGSRSLSGGSEPRGTDTAARGTLEGRNFH